MFNKQLTYVITFQVFSKLAWQGKKDSEGKEETGGASKASVALLPQACLARKNGQRREGRDRRSEQSERWVRLYLEEISI